MHGPRDADDKKELASQQVLLKKTLLMKHSAGSLSEDPARTEGREVTSASFPRTVSACKQDARVQDWAKRNNASQSLSGDWAEEQDPAYEK